MAIDDETPIGSSPADDSLEAYRKAVENRTQITLDARDVDLLLASLYQMQSTTFAALGAAYLALHDPLRAKEKLDEALEIANKASERLDGLYEAMRAKVGGGENE